MAAKRLRNVALGVGAAWACWWVFFETAEAMGDGQFGQAILFLVAMFGAVALAWKWPAIGGALFLAEGVGAVVLFSPGWTRHFHLGQFLLLFAIMPLPPLAAGALLLLSRRPVHPAEHLPA
ncbi:MAG: hypothetical protein ACLP59_26330 [Bryobacteraceae bacterium]